jgi:hypothetical protein
MTDSSSSKQNWNWRIWAGFLLAVAAVLSYGLIFLKFPVTRNFPWVSWLLFAVAAWLLGIGVRLARREPGVYRGKIAGPVLAVLSVALTGFFAFGTIYITAQLPPSKEAPTVGSKAPAFALADTEGKTVTLDALLSDPIPQRNGSPAKPRGVVLIFYRGYW